MHGFYTRMQTVFKKEGSNRSRFCRKYGYNYQTLQAYWNTDKLPPGNVLEDLTREYNVSLDYLVLGRRNNTPAQLNSVGGRIVEFLEKQGQDRLLEIEGAIRMYHYMTSLDTASFQPPDDLDEPTRLLLGLAYDKRDLSRVPVKLEKLTELLTELGRLIQGGHMNKKDKEHGRELLNQVVLNIYERRVEPKDEWASLEEVE